MSGSPNHSGPPHETGEELSPNGGRAGQLPPPAFPPGRRRVQLRRRLEAAEDSLGSEDSASPSFDEAFISPDDPIPERAGGFESAFISPDDPIPQRSADADTAGEQASSGWEREEQARTTGAVSDPDVDTDEGVVTGIGSDAHLDPAEVAYGGDPYLTEVLHAVKRLAASLDQKGEGGLRTTSEMTRLEAQLRSYCVGYLAGRRAEDEEG